MKKIIVMLLCLALMGTFMVSCTNTNGPKKTGEPDSTEEPQPTEAPKNYGLHVEDDGTITLNGDPYYCFGTNWHGGFSRLIEDLDLDYTKYFEALRDGIPIIRTMMNVFYVKDQWNAVYNDDAFFGAMDKYIAYCEKYHVGLVMSMMWNYANFYEFCGEKPADCLGDPNAQGTKLMQEYVRKVVSRYKDSPAVFAWEVGNEGCLAADRGDGTSIQMGNYYRIFAETVREIDPYRLITTGDSMIFECTHALRTTGKWEPNDTMEQRIETLEIYNPDPINAICVHFYGHADTYQRVELVPTDMQIAKDMKKGFIVGEYGAGYSEWARLKGKDMEDNWISIVDELVTDNVQIALQWDFGRCAELNDEWSIELGFIKDLYQNEYQYNKLKEVNEKLVADGKNKSADYWAQAKPLIYGTEGFELDGRVKNNSKNANDLLKEISVLSPSVWEGLMKTKTGKAYTGRATVKTTLADGSEGMVFQLKTDGEAGGLATVPNRLPIGKLVDMKEGESYTVKITAKLTYGDGRTSLDGGKVVIEASKNDNGIEVNADGQWHTYEYRFTMVGSTKPSLTVGGDSAKAYASPGFVLQIAELEMTKG
ncbi:MAG: cellulase family glycosylhydrolase [Clostridia bacterium]|nr:cellulase family glycosylhydrolase [Clostridia bacterium]